VRIQGILSSPLRCVDSLAHLALRVPFRHLCEKLRVGQIRRVRLWADHPVYRLLS
jgi:hypothetical protein